MRKLNKNRVEMVNLFAIAAEPDRRLKDPLHGAAEMIERQIRDQGLRLGALLDPEYAIAKRVGYPLAVVTGAIDALVMTGLLARQPHGIVITGEVARLTAEDCNCFPTVTQQFEARKLIGPASAELATANAAELQIEQLNLIVNDMDSRVSAAQTLIEEERSFNLALAEMTRNPLLLTCSLQLWKPMNSHTWSVIRGRLEGQAEWKRTATDYRAVAEAVAHGKAWTAGSAMRRHLQDLDRRYFSGRAVGSNLATS